MNLPTENLLLTADHKTVKLADFGLAREESLTEMMTAETGTYRWMAPEVENKNHFLYLLMHALFMTLQLKISPDVTYGGSYTALLR